MAESLLYWRHLSTAYILARRYGDEPTYGHCRLCQQEVRIDRIDLAFEHWTTKHLSSAPLSPLGGR